MNYKKTGRLDLYPLMFNHVFGVPAIDLAKEFYSKHNDLNFEQDLEDYMRTGFVCARPNLFAMVKVMDFEGEKMWHIQIAVGRLWELLSVLPFYLPKLCWCRNNQPDKMRIVSTNHFAQMVMKRFQRQIEKTNNHGGSAV